MKNSRLSQSLLHNKRAAKLTALQVQDIRRCLAEGQASRDIAKNNAVGYRAIYQIQKGFSWCDLPWESEQQKQRARKRCTPHAQKKLTHETVLHIRQELARGVTGNQLARIHQVSRQTISHIKLGVTWKV